ncbi:MAG TPA: pilus assembly protein TadG-related protein [Natronosporangium sp.]|nr:pilus assembly protein TadG-related protein [Natronosporangium sp.]
MSRDSGRVSVFLAIAVAGILAIIGVAVDAAGQLRTLTRAQNLAAEAARSAGQGIDGQRAMAGDAVVVDPELATRYASEYLATAFDHIEQDHLPPSVVPVDGGTAVRITVTLYYQPQILGLFGYGQIEVTATAAATLVTD